MLLAQNPRCEYQKNPIGIDVLQPRFFWIVNSEIRNTFQIAYQIQVCLNSDFCQSLVWDSGIIESDESIHVEYAGKQLNSSTRYFYRVKIWDNHSQVSDWSECAFFETGLLHKEDWKANWIIRECEIEPSKTVPCPMFRTTFDVENAIKSARVYVTALGLYELHLNGKKVGDALFTPGWTSYSKVLQYQTYDITNMVIEGGNAVGAIVGEGWYKGCLDYTNKRNVFGNTLAILIQILIEYEDGSSQIVTSNTSWKASSGAILKSEIYHGEKYDANLEKDGWDTYNYNDIAWENVTELDNRKALENKNALIAQINEPVRKIEEIKPVELIKTPLGETVIDFGQNMVGWVKFSVSGKRGERVVIKHAEMLDFQGNFYTENLRSAKQEIEYILSGKEEEIFEPHFTFQGFRYIKVEEFPKEISLNDFTGIVIHSDMQITGRFECSNPLLNQLQHNIFWSQKGNFFDLPIDCPQRDERLGWTGDAQIFANTASFNMSTALFFKKWLNDLKADQRSDGAVPFVVPQIFDEKAYASSGWGDAAVVCPWIVYLNFGDKRILENQYKSMKDWVEYIRKQGDNEFLWNTGFHFGDWLALDARAGERAGATDNDFISTVFYAQSTKLLSKIAKIIGNDQDANEYEKLYCEIFQAFQNEFITPSGRLAVQTQTAHALAIEFELINEKDKKRVADFFVGELYKNKYHLNTGFIGTPYLCNALQKVDQIAEAYNLLLNEDYPSWLYQVKKGATTIWEHWDGIKEDGSFWDKKMNSFNHYAYGAIGNWLYKVVGGLDTKEDEPGYKKFIINPIPGGGISYAKITYQSLYGEISSQWKLLEEGFLIKISVPCNTSCEFILPKESKFFNVKDEFGKYVKNSLQNEEKIILYSGNYEIFVKL